MTRYLFFDVDGTLLPFGKALPRDTLAALLKAKENGHKLFLSTGRSPAELDPRLGEIPFDGGVYSGGARAFVNGEDIYGAFFSDEDIAFFTEESLSRGWKILVQTDTMSYYLDDFDTQLKALFDRYIGRDIYINNLRRLPSFDGVHGVTKLILITPDGDMEKAHALFDSRFDVINNTVGVPSSLMAEVAQKNVNKGRAMLETLRHCAVPVEASMAFGDGANDYEIIQAAGCGVAMGNAEEGLKACADYVTADCDDDGIGKALRHFGLI